MEITSNSTTGSEMSARCVNTIYECYISEYLIRQNDNCVIAAGTTIIIQLRYTVKLKDENYYYFSAYIATASILAT